VSTRRHGASEDEWEGAKSVLSVGDVVSGEVRLVAPFGLFIRIPGVPVDAVLLALDLDPAGTPLAPCEWPAVGDQIEAVVVDLPDWKRQVALSRRLSVYPSADAWESP
jgi:ribosomal protein S1